MAAQKNKATLEAMWATMESLTPKSSAEEIDKLTQYFEPDAVAYLNGMTAPPAKGYEGIKGEVGKLVQYWKMEESKIRDEIFSAEGKKIIKTMDNHLKILGQDVEGVYECEIVSFSDAGKIQEYLLYLNPEKIMAVFAKAQEGK